MDRNLKFLSIWSMLHPVPALWTSFAAFVTLFSDIAFAIKGNAMTNEIHLLLFFQIYHLSIKKPQVASMKKPHVLSMKQA